MDRMDAFCDKRAGYDNTDRTGQTRGTDRSLLRESSLGRGRSHRQMSAHRQISSCGRLRSRKILGGILAIVMLASGFLSACGAGSGDGTAGGPGQTAGQAAGLTAGQDGGPKGRYREEAVPVPETMKGALCEFFQGKDGQLELVLFQTDDEGRFTSFSHYTCSLDDGPGWVEDADWWGTDVISEAKIDLRHICYGGDGKYYLCGTDSEVQEHLFQVGEDGKAVEILQKVLCPSTKEGEIHPDKIAVNAKGQILLSTFKKAYVYSPMGEELFQFEQDFSHSSDQRSLLFDEESYVTFSGGDIVRYSLEDGEVAERIVYEDLILDGDSLGHLAEDGEGGIYLADANGLSHINSGGTLWERLIDGDLTTLRYQDMALYGWIPGKAEDHYAIFSKVWQDEIWMFHYVYDPDMPAVPPVTLTVYSLERFSSVQQAAALFQQQNPDILVEYRTGAADEGGGDGDGQILKEDMLRSLNTELLNGKGADVLLLDGLPRDSFKEKGVLMDMRELFQEIREETPLLAAVAEDFTEADGAVYAMPSRIAFPVLFGGADAVEAFRSLDGISAYCSREGTPLVGRATYENLLRQLAILRYQEIFDGQDGLPKEETLKKYLETVKILGEQVDARWAFSPQELAADPVGLTNAPVKRGGGNVIDLDRGYAACQVAVLDSIAGAALEQAALEKHPGMAFRSVGQIYLPSAIVGINEASRQKEAAKAFVRTLFSTQVQQVEFHDRDNEGFPVQTQALEAWKGMVKNVTMGTGMADGYMLIAEWPDEEARAGLVELAKSLTEPVEVDQTVMEMIVDGAKGYLEGREDVDMAAKAILGKLKLYQAERR